MYIRTYIHMHAYLLSNTIHICFLGIAQINNTGPTRTATVTIDKLACGTEYTIKAGGIFNQMLAGPRLNLGNTSKLLCEIIRNQLVEGKINAFCI